MPQKTNKKSFELNAQWTAIEPVKGWRHYRITRIFYNEEKKFLELTSVCDSHVKLEEPLQVLKTDNNWYPGWR